MRSSKVASECVVVGILSCVSYVIRLTWVKSM